MEIIKNIIKPIVFCTFFARGARLENPVHLVFISNGETATLSQPRVLVVAEENSRAVVIQDHEVYNAKVNFLIILRIQRRAWQARKDGRSWS